MTRRLRFLFSKLQQLPQLCSHLRAMRNTDPSCAKLFVWKPGEAMGAVGEQPSSLLIDEAVYSRNRAFRLPFSCKFGKTARLLPTPRFKCKNLVSRTGWHSFRPLSSANVWKDKFRARRSQYTYRNTCSAKWQRNPLCAVSVYVECLIHIADRAGGLLRVPYLPPRRLPKCNLADSLRRGKNGQRSLILLSPQEREGR